MSKFHSHCYWFGVIYYLYRADLADWSREICNIHLLNGAHLDNWLLIFTSREQGCANDLLNMLQKVCRSLGMRVNSPNLWVICFLRQQCSSEAGYNVDNIATLVVPSIRTYRSFLIVKLNWSSCWQWHDQLVPTRWLIGQRTDHSKIETLPTLAITNLRNA